MNRPQGRHNERARADGGETALITITIEWSEPHHPGDGYDMIAGQLAGGHDEGPLLIVPTEGRRRPGPGPEALIFADVQSYLAHIAHH